jgi:hypothetical protein
MSFSKISAIAIALTISGSIFAAPAQAVPMVTYNWTTTSVGPGPNSFSPTATFEVPLSDVLNGVIPQLDISNIQATFPGLTFNSALPSSGGNDFSAFVNPVTGAFIYHDINQGLSVFAFAGTNVNDATTFLSITVDNVARDSSGNALTSVADQFNVIDNGQQDGPFPNAGFWTASFPTITTAVPEPSTWTMMILGFLGVGFVAYRRKQSGPALLLA